MIPTLAKVYLPVLLMVQVQVWPDAYDPPFMAGQIEQETCITLQHRSCWNPEAELKTAREYGFGLGQTTRALNANGTVRFDKFAELKAAYPSLAKWEWNNRYKARYQIVAIVEMNRTAWSAFPDAATPRDRLAFTLSAYNGGKSGVMQDRVLCRRTPGCLPNVWYGNVELNSTKSRVKWKGYGKSAYEINREYVHHVEARSAKYRPYYTGVAL